MKNIREKLAIIFTIALIIHMALSMLLHPTDVAIVAQNSDLMKTITLLIIGYYFGSMHTPTTEITNETTEITNEKTEA